MMRRTLTVMIVVASATLAASVCAAITDIDQVGQRFNVPSLTLAVGDTIHLHNPDDVIHNLNVIDAHLDPEDQGLQKPGETITKTFTKAGDFQVRCAIHPRMKMTVTVQ